jgi:hypothetical protein
MVSAATRMPWFFRNAIFLSAHEAREALALRREVRRALVIVVVGDEVAVERRGLARRDDPVVLQHVERHGPRLVRVEHDAAAR